MRKRYQVFCNLLLSAALFSGALSGCMTKTPKKPPLNGASDDATIKIAEAATSVSESLSEMAKVEKVIMPPDRDNTVTIPSTYNLQKRASVDWSGPIEELTRRIANAAEYRLRVLGQAPSVPVLIDLNVQDESLAEILRDIDYQAGKKAGIHVYPNQQVVELRYARIYS